MTGWENDMSHVGRRLAQVFIERRRDAARFLITG
jgi:hypothetical protein